MRRESFRLSGFADHERVSAALATKGLSPDAASAVATRLARASSELSASAEKGAPGIAFFVPGRIEVLGKHTDYAGGSSLVCALQRGIAIVGTPRNDRTVTVRDCDLDVQAEFEIDAGTAARQGHWSNYGISVARRIVRDFPGDHSGASLAIASTLPVASGMSSSSALTVSIFLALSAVNHLDDREDYKRLFRRPTALAEYLGAVESGRPYAGFDADAGVGTLGGNEDHTAILCSDPGLLKWFSYLPIQLRGGVALPPGYVLAVAFSGVRAEKTGRALDLYNAVSDKAAAIAEVWRSETGRSEAHLGAIASIPGYSRTEVMLALLNRPHERFSEAELIDRLYQFHYESQVILPRAVDALQRQHDLPVAPLRRDPK